MQRMDRRLQETARQLQGHVTAFEPASHIYDNIQNVALVFGLHSQLAV